MFSSIPGRASKSKRFLRRKPMSSKMGNMSFYKGRGGNIGGHLTKGGNFVADMNKRWEIVLPNVEDDYKAYVHKMVLPPTRRTKVPSLDFYLKDTPVLEKMKESQAHMLQYKRIRFNAAPIEDIKRANAHMEKFDSIVASGFRALRRKRRITKQNIREHANLAKYGNRGGKWFIRRPVAPEVYAQYDKVKPLDRPHHVAGRAERAALQAAKAGKAALDGGKSPRNSSSARLQ